MSYQDRVKRLTIPLESNQNIIDAKHLLQDLVDVLAKIQRSPNSERNKLHIAQYEVMSTNTELKSKANDKPLSSYYKGAT
ncbi:MAG: hypothetical protein CMA63_02705 [Euryarchaeota archaeon]|nr:hypothetical protein [Euryarchaeota archaeon]